MFLQNICQGLKKKGKKTVIKTTLEINACHSTKHELVKSKTEAEKWVYILTKIKFINLFNL